MRALQIFKYYGSFWIVMDFFPIRNPYFGLAKKEKKWIHKNPKSFVTRNTEYFFIWPKEGKVFLGWTNFLIWIIMNHDDPWVIRSFSGGLLYWRKVVMKVYHRKKGVKNYIRLIEIRLQRWVNVSTSCFKCKDQTFLFLFSFCTWDDRKSDQLRGSRKVYAIQKVVSSCSVLLYKSTFDVRKD